MFRLVWCRESLLQIISEAGSGFYQSTQSRFFLVKDSDWRYSMLCMTEDNKLAMFKVFP